MAKPEDVCELGLSSNCMMRGEIKITYRCDHCGFNRNVHKARLEKLHTQGLQELKGYKKGLRGLVLRTKK